MAASDEPDNRIETQQNPMNGAEPAAPTKDTPRPESPATSGSLDADSKAGLKQELDAKIDGAEDDVEKTDPDATEKDPFSNGLSVRWLIPTDGFGLTDIELSPVDHRPRFSDHMRWDLSIPFGVHFVTEQNLGLPPELYDIQVQLRWVQPIADRFGFDVSVIPGFFSDFDSSHNNGFRVGGHLIGTYRQSDDWMFALGAMYLGRQDVPILPAGGLVWNIRPETQLELLMPNPRISQQLPSATKEQQFVYTGFELFGGNSWAVSHFNTTEDTVTYRDFRYVIGYECGKPGQSRDALQIGYVFARTVEFKHSPEVQHPSPTLLLQLVLGY